MSTSLLSLPVTSLQTSVSVVLVPTTVFAQKIHKLYFPYHHLYTNIQNVNIIAIITSDFTSNFGFCGLGAYHSFCTKNSQTLLSISSFVHKYPNIQMSTSLLSLPVTSLQTSVSVVLVPTTVFVLSTLYIQEAAICTQLLCTKL